MAVNLYLSASGMIDALMALIHCSSFVISFLIEHITLRLIEFFINLFALLHLTSLSDSLL